MNKELALGIMLEVNSGLQMGSLQKNGGGLKNSRTEMI